MYYRQNIFNGTREHHIQEKVTDYQWCFVFLSTFLVCRVLWRQVCHYLVSLTPNSVFLQKQFLGPHMPHITFL